MHCFAYKSLFFFFFSTRMVIILGQEFDLASNFIIGTPWAKMTVHCQNMHAFLYCVALFCCKLNKVPGRIGHFARKSTTNAKIAHFSVIVSSASRGKHVTVPMYGPHSAVWLCVFTQVLHTEVSSKTKVVELVQFLQQKIIDALKGKPHSKTSS